MASPILNIADVATLDLAERSRQRGSGKLRTVAR